MFSLRLSPCGYCSCLWQQDSGWSVLPYLSYRPLQRSARHTTRGACPRPELTALWGLVKHQATSSPAGQSWSSGAARWAGGRGGGAFLLTAASSPLPPGCALALHACSVRCSSEWNRQGVLTDPVWTAFSIWGARGGRAPGRRDGTSAMGQLCCFPFSRDEEKISKCGLYRAESEVLDYFVWLSSRGSFGYCLCGR